MSFAADHEVFSHRTSSAFQYNTHTHTQTENSMEPRKFAQYKAARRCRSTRHLRMLIEAFNCVSTEKTTSAHVVVRGNTHTHRQTQTPLQTCQVRLPRHLWSGLPKVHHFVDRSPFYAVLLYRFQGVTGLLMRIFRRGRLHGNGTGCASCTRWMLSSATRDSSL